jgi:hypothetical protein
MNWRQFLSHFRNQKRSSSNAGNGQDDDAYDDRASMAPFFQETQHLKRFTHQDKCNNKNTNSTEERELIKWTCRLAYMTGGLATATFLVAGFSGWQVYESRHAAEQQHIDTLAALDKTDGIMKIDQRAWIGIEYIQPIPPIPEIGKTFSVNIRLKNTGKTPARNMVQSGSFGPVKSLAAINFAIENENKHDVGQLMPNGGATLPFTPLINSNTREPLIFTQELFDAFNSTNFKIVVYGRIDYSDIFGDPHWVTYCGFLEVPFNGSFAFCDIHNDGDNYRQP